MAYIRILWDRLHKKKHTHTCGHVKAKLPHAPSCPGAPFGDGSVAELLQTYEGIKYPKMAVWNFPDHWILEYFRCASFFHTFHRGSSKHVRSSCATCIL